MKKIILSLIVLPMFVLCFSINLNAQSSETDLDQVELMKQFIGTWKWEWREDSTIIWEIIPSNVGYESNISWQAHGETFLTSQGIMGFAQNKQLVNWSFLLQEGGIYRDVGKFLSDKKLTGERFTVDHKHVTASFEIYFQTPDKFKWIHKFRGMKETWDDAVVREITYTRVKK